MPARNSFYEATVTRAPAAPAPAGDLKCDVVVIGAGYTGLMAALELAERKYAVRVLEADLIGAAASGRNGGQLGTGQRRPQKWLEHHYGDATAAALWKIAEEAKRIAKVRIVQHGIACDLRPGILHVAHRADLFEDLKADHGHLLTRYGYPHAVVLSKEEVRAQLGTQIYFGGVLDRDAGHLHPLKYALGLATAAQDAGAVFHENTRALALDFDSGRVTTAAGTIEAAHVLVACNGYLGGLVPEAAPVIMPINNYIAATSPLGDRAKEIIRDDVAVADTRFVINYYKLSADGRLLFGGGESYSPNLPGNIGDIVRPRLARVFPQLAQSPFDYAWGGTLAITLNRMPHLGRIGKRGYFAHGYSGHGVAMAGMAGKLLAEAVAGTAERFDVMAGLNIPAFPGGTHLRHPLRVLAMLYGKLRDAI